jgi:hypothetical protein
VQLARDVCSGSATCQRFVIGVAVFAVAPAGCGLAPNIHELVPLKYEMQKNFYIFRGLFVVKKSGATFYGAGGSVAGQFEFRQT